ncbi:MAG: heterodisulfide reductase-related iron-sulfur binding cluster [Hydrogenobaculum sp.]|nr:MAG: Fe-S oxidoreductase [Hydrogenobaculum sp.]
MSEISIGGLKDFNFDLDDPKFYDEEALYEEAKRVYLKCKDCRMCVNFCPSFPALFDAVDKKNDNIEALTKEELAKPLELCFHCKQCYFKCPYTPPHEWKLDFPHLSLRYKAIKFKNQGAKITDKLMLDTDLVGKLSVPFGKVVNKTMEVKPVRLIMEKTVGIDQRAKLPPINQQSFVSFLKDNLVPVKNPVRKAVLFYTCLLNYNFLEKGKALLHVLYKNNIHIEVPEQNCCGIPFFDIGDLDSSIKKAKYNVDMMIDYVRNGYDVIVPVPTCALQLKHEYPLLLRTPESKELSEKVYEIGDYLFSLNQENLLNKDFKNSMGKIDYHIACHLKSLGVGYKSAALMRMIPNTKVRIVEICSGHDGTFGVKKDTFDMAVSVGKPLFENIANQKADLVVSDCPLAGNFIELNTSRAVKSPIEVLSMAYGD